MSEPSTRAIRRATAADAPALAAFAARTFHETFASDNDPDDLRTYLESAYGVAQQSGEIEDPGTATLLAHERDTLVAYAQVRRVTPPTCVTHEAAVELRRFYVDRPFQGRGVAQALMHAVHDAARTLDARHLWLGVWERNPRAIAFYRNEGFVDVGAKDFYVGPDRQTDRVLVAPVRR